MVVRIFSLIFVVLFASLAAAQENSINQSLDAINSVGNGGVRHGQAITAWKLISRSGPDALPAILKAIDDKKPLAANWLRAAVDQIAERGVQNGQSLPKNKLEAAVFDQDYSPRARRLAYEWLRRVDESAEKRIVPQMLNDTSLEMRRDAVAKALDDAASAESDDQKKKLFAVALTAARDKDQVDTAYEKLVELGEKVELAKHFGFVTSWQVIGPFDNTDKGGFSVAYPPEADVDLEKSYKGKSDAVVKWKSHTTDDKYGMVDLNKALSKHMGAAGYAYAEFETSKAMAADLRLGCVCAAKVWLNGVELMEHEVYHSGEELDQYIAKGKLKAGKNTILLKICQNEQTDSWAQDWQFQLRVCDEVGTAIHSQ